MATTNAVLDDNPAPTGSVVVTDPVPPPSGRTMATAPATKRAHAGSRACSVDGSRATSRSTTAGSGAWSERSTTSPDPSGEKRTVVPRSTAMGRATPPL